MTRVDLFVNAHKGLRSAMFEAAALVARTDFAQPAEVEDAVVRVRRVLGFLREHAAHEDRILLPAVARRCPELASGLRREHARSGGLETRVARLLDRLPEADCARRVALGRRLLAEWNRVVAEQLGHMEREETEANRILWAHHTDVELAGLLGDVLSTIEPARRAEWMDLILPALSAPERRRVEAMTVARAET